MRIFLLLSATVASTTAAAAAETRTFAANAVKTVELDNGSGTVTIAGDATDKVSVTAEKVKFEEGCELVTEEKAGKLALHIKRPTLSHATCDVNWKLSVPPATALKVNNGSGPVAVDGVHGRIEFKTGSGNVSLKDAPALASGMAGSGAIDASGLAAPVDLLAGSGTIRIAYKTAPASGAAKLKTGSGNIVVELPAGAKVHANLLSPGGRLTNELGDTADAKFAIDAASGSGSLSVKKI